MITVIVLLYTCSGSVISLEQLKMFSWPTDSVLWYLLTSSKTDGLISVNIYSWKRYTCQDFRSLARINSVQKLGFCCLFVCLTWEEINIIFNSGEILTSDTACAQPQRGQGPWEMWWYLVIYFWIEWDLHMFLVQTKQETCILEGYFLPKFQKFGEHSYITSKVKNLKR